MGRSDFSGHWPPPDYCQLDFFPSSTVQKNPTNVGNSKFHRPEISQIPKPNPQRGEGRRDSPCLCAVSCMEVAEGTPIQRIPLTSPCQWWSTFPQVEKYVKVLSGVVTSPQDREHTFSPQASNPLLNVHHIQLSNQGSYRACPPNRWMP